MKKILITGASGFVGTHLVEHLLDAYEYEVHGTAYGTPDQYLANLMPTGNIHHLNLLDEIETQSLIEFLRPDYVIHLAALSSAGASFDKPALTISNNAVAQIHLLEALKKMDRPPVTLIIGSAEEYGIVESNESPVSESNQFRPISPYAVSKITQDYLGLQYFLTYNLPIIRLRPFNHVGERQPPAFVLPAFSKQIAEAEQGIRESLLIVGDLSVTRDFTDVKDMVKAYALALTHCQPGEVYNIGSGRKVIIQELLDILLSKANVSIRVEKDPTKFRPADVKTLVCDASKFMTATGWKPAISLEETVGRVLDYWRQQVKLVTKQ